MPCPKAPSAMEQKEASPGLKPEPAANRILGPQAAWTRPAPPSAPRRPEPLSATRLQAHTHISAPPRAHTLGLPGAHPQGAHTLAARMQGGVAAAEEGRNRRAVHAQTAWARGRGGEAREPATAEGGGAQARRQAGRRGDSGRTTGGPSRASEDSLAAPGVGTPLTPGTGSVGCSGLDP